MSNFFSRSFNALNPDKNPDINLAFEHAESFLPSVWLLGKTGAGKSSLIQALTGDSSIQIGQGFKPCTLTAQSYDFPQANPLLSFLDTRGLAEAHYDATEDIAWCTQRSHALLVIVKAEETEQSSVLDALKAIKNSRKIAHASLIITAIDEVDVAEQTRLINYHKQQFEKVWPSLELLTVDWFSARKKQSIEDMILLLSEQLPIIRQVFDQHAAKDQEEHNFQQLRHEILWYAGAAAATDALPAVGLVAVPSIQTKMLHSLANHYGLPWSKKNLTQLLGAMGSSFVLKYLSQFGIRQLVKFIPAYGQVIGGATAAAASYATTYALGRIACLYFYRSLREEPVSTAELQTLFKQALKDSLPKGAHA